MLIDLNLHADDIDLKGEHPELGDTSLRELLSSWVVHDHGHINQIARVMARNYADQVGPRFKKGHGLNI